MQTKTHKRTEYALRKLSRKRFGSHRWRENADVIHRDYHASALPHATKKQKIRNILTPPGFDNWQFIVTPRTYAIRMKRGAARKVNPPEKHAYLFLSALRDLIDGEKPYDCLYRHGVFLVDGFLVVSKKRKDSPLWRIAYAWIRRFRLFMEATPISEVREIVEEVKQVSAIYTSRKPNKIPPRQGGFRVSALKHAAGLIKLNY